MLTGWGKVICPSAGIPFAVRVDRLGANHPDHLGFSETSNICGKKSTVNEGNLVFYYFKIFPANRPVPVTDPGPIVAS
jgi:hypothetical protein